MQQDVPLTDLCAIWLVPPLVVWESVLTAQSHVNPIKYTCPRDGVHTCSLPCVKRHKKWAQCSGVRDPAEYRKRSELATASSIDKDFNFITKVERSLSRADSTVADRGIDLVPARLRPNDARPKFEVEAEARGIKIVKAPKGLSRSKQNRTHWGGQPKCVVWTVEWLCQDGRKAMSAANETKPVRELFDAVLGSKRGPRKRKRSSDTTETEHENRHQRMDKPVTNRPQTSPRDPLSETLQPSPEHGRHEAHLPPQPPSDPPDVYFYLHRPNTESRFKCLIPLVPETTLSKSLEGKTLLEFPTIHVRSEPPDKLEEPFIVEEDYNQRHGVDIPINVVTATVLSATEADEVDGGADLEEGELMSTLADDSTGIEIDETKVLEVLSKDLGG